MPNREGFRTIVSGRDYMALIMVQEMDAGSSKGDFAKIPGVVNLSGH